MFFTTKQINPSLTILSDNYATIRDEFNNVRDELEYTNWNGNNEYSSIKKSPYDGWKVAPLYAKGVGIHKDNAAKMPTLLKLCLKAGIVQRCGISVLEPNKNIDWHIDTDPTYKDKIIVRGLWGLDINPQNQEVCEIHLKNKKETFANNRFHLFWGRSLHHVYNTLSTPRYCLCFDNLVTIP